MLLGTNRVSEILRGVFKTYYQREPVRAFTPFASFLMKNTVKLPLWRVTVYWICLVPFGTCNWPLIRSDIPASSWET